jgi:hypothetical protein
VVAMKIIEEGLIGSVADQIFEACDEAFIVKTKEVLGLNKSDICKFLKISRISLDKYVKGLPIKNEVSQRCILLNQIVSFIDCEFGSTLASYSSNLIINGKTFKKHILDIDEVIEINDIAYLLSEMTKNRPTKTKTSNSHNYINTIGIGKIG